MHAPGTIFFFAWGPVRNATSVLRKILEKSYKEASSFFMLASPPPEKSVAHPVSTDLLTEIWNSFFTLKDEKSNFKTIRGGADVCFLFDSEQ